jgi:hypothetical protein
VTETGLLLDDVRMGADVIFAIIADVLGVPTLGVGIWVDRRARWDRQAMHWRRLLVIAQNLDRAAMRWASIVRDRDNERLPEARATLNKHLEDLSREKGGTYTPRWVTDLQLYPRPFLTATFVEDDLHPSLESAVERLHELLRRGPFARQARRDHVPAGGSTLTSAGE